jgi:hypothetical protein
METTIQEVKTKYEQRLLKIKGVVSVGIGQGKDKTQVIIVGLIQDESRSRRRIPSVLEGYHVEIQIVGTIKAL